MPRADSTHTTLASSVMTRAWAIFRETYSYPRIPFASIGRHCFNSCLTRAWAEHRATAQLAATPTAALAEQVFQIESVLAALTYRGWSTNVTRERNRLNEELRPLVTELGRRPVRDTLTLSAAA